MPAAGLAPTILMLISWTSGLGLRDLAFGRFDEARNVDAAADDDTSDSTSFASVGESANV